MNNTSSCIFCRIASGQVNAHRIWEDDRHIAFLSIYPNTPGAAVVVPRMHYSSYAFAASDDVLTGLVIAAKKVAILIDNAFEDVGRTALVLEGFGVDHLHAKLFPMHGTGKLKEWRPIKSNVPKYFNFYEGYISSHDFKEEDPKILATQAQLIRDMAKKSGQAPTASHKN